ncbi:MAG: molybdopterin-guanine dinucleotide biosynthesis protein B [Pseudomonadota bacterium]|nr:molybdopterin-guanine dinucleotide biosynthesis protein B [Pseudomonadota bacterium]
MRIMGIAGWSGSGKTTLMVRLLPELIKRGYSVSTIKHAHHNFDIDRPGKDSYEHRRAGATEVMISSENRWALMHELLGQNDKSISELITHMSTVDILLVEGFKWESHQKIEVYRPSVGKPLLAPDDPNIVAVASDEVLKGLNVAVLQLDDIVGIADFIVDKICLESA